MVVQIIIIFSSFREGLTSSMFSLRSDFSWLDHLQLQNTYSSAYFRDQITLVSGDGFTVPFHAPFLLASSRLLKGIYQDNLRGKDIFLPSVRGDTLMLVAELLRRGVTGGIVCVENTGQKLKEVQGVMDLLQTEVNVALKMVTTGSAAGNRSYLGEDELRISEVTSMSHKWSNYF